MTQTVNVYDDSAVLWFCNKLNYNDMYANGWTASVSPWQVISPNITESNGQIQASASASASQYYIYAGVTNTKIDLTSINKIKFMLAFDKTSGGNNVFLDIGINSSATKDAQDQDVTRRAWNRLVNNGSPSSLSFGIYEFDVTQYTGEFYLYWMASQHNDSSLTKMAAMWVE